MKTFVSTAIVVIFLLNIKNQCESAAIDTTIKDKISATSQSNRTSSNDEKNNTLEINTSSDATPISSVDAAHIRFRGKSVIKDGYRAILERGNLHDNHT